MFNQVEIDFESALTVDNWFIGNLQHSGFYRVNYDDTNWNLLINQLKTSHLKIESTARAQLIDDCFNLGRAEEIRQIKFCQLTEYLVKETDPLVFSAVFTSFNYFAEMLSTNEISFSYFKV